MLSIHPVVCYLVFSRGLSWGPLSFIIYVDDLPTSISSKIPLYADDVIVYRAILSSDNITIL